jgi:sortase A
LLAAILVLCGALALTDAVLTLVWQEPLTALYASIRQHDLRSALEKVEHAVPSPLARHALVSISDERRRIAFLGREEERRAGEGGAVGRITIPSIAASFVVVKGTSTSALQGGPGIYPETGFPGVGNTTAIAGHRTTYLAPFRHVDALRAGSPILLEMPYGRFTYTVIGQRVVAPTDVSAAVANVGYPRLVLSACTPLFSAAKRLLVFARLSRTVPVGAARRLPGGLAARPFLTPPTRVKRSQIGRPQRRSTPPHSLRVLPPVLEPVQAHVGAPLI